jgi:hypothetical protein
MVFPRGGSERYAIAIPAEVARKTPPNNIDRCAVVRAQLQELQGKPVLIRYNRIALFAEAICSVLLTFSR